MVAAFLLLAAMADLGAQPLKNRHRVGLEVSAGRDPNLGVNYQFLAQSRLSVDMGCHFFKYRLGTSQPVFNGDRTINFARSKTDTFGHISQSVPIGSSEWEAVSTVKPFEPVPEYMPGFAFQSRLGARFLFSQKGGKVVWFLEPGASATFFSYFKSNDSYAVENRAEAEHFYQGAFTTYRIVKVDEIVKETRQMRLRGKWIYGICYDFGFDRRLSPRFFTTLRLSLGLNVNEGYFLNQPRPASHYWWRPGLTVGALLGKVPKKRRVENL